MKKNIAVDVAFTIVTEKDFEDLTQLEVMQALLTRGISLMNHWEKDAIGFVDEYEVEEEDPDYPPSEWQLDVRDNNTQLGYQDWVAHKLEANRHDKA